MSKARKNQAIPISQLSEAQLDTRLKTLGEWIGGLDKSIAFHKDLGFSGPKNRQILESMKDKRKQLCKQRDAALAMAQSHDATLAKARGETMS